MGTARKSYPPVDSDERTWIGDVTSVDTQGAPVYDEIVRLGEPAVRLAEMLLDDAADPRGLRGRRLA
ncbi:MAG: hypothetical protein ACM3XN_03300 [Chloroflexota bacterium]